MKICTNPLCPLAGQLQPFENFHKGDGKFGYRPYCKICINAQNAAYRKTEKGQAAIKKGVNKYQQTVKGKAVARKAISRYRKTPKGKIANRNAEKKQRHSKRESAHQVVYHYVKHGHIPPPKTLPCADCGLPANEYHHYNGYEPEHWLDIVPLCIECHNKRHH